MPARLPTPGSDNGTWGGLLNGFLQVAHNDDGTLQQSAITAAGGYVKPSTGIPESDLDTTTQAALTKANSSLQTSNNLSDLASAPTARTNLGLGTSSARNVGTTSGTVSAGDDSRFVEPSVGVYVPSGWGSNLKAKLASKGKIAVVGDSVTKGYYTSNLDTRSWPSQLCTRLQTAYGNGGTGWRGIVDSTVWAAVANIPSEAQTSYVAAGNYYTLNGTWTNYASNAFGIGGASIYTAQTGAWAQVSVTGTTINIYTIGGNSAWNYQIDGGTVTAGAIGSYQSVNAQTISGLSAGTHTVRILYNGNGSTDKLYLNGVSGENASGVVVDNFAIYGAQSGLINNSDGLTNGAAMGGNLHPADLVIYNMGLNDAGNNVSVQTFMSNLEGYLAAVRDGGTATGAVDLLIVMSHAGKFDTTNKLFANYSAILRGAAGIYNAAYINIWTQYRNSWNYFNTLNGWGNATSVGSSGSDSVHLSDAGATLYYNAINGVIQAYIG